MSKLKSSIPAISLQNGADVIAALEQRHLNAKRALAVAEDAMQAASAAYDTALGESREAALAARRTCTDAEIDLDIARREADVVGHQVTEAHEALRLATIDFKLSEAERLRSVFEKTAREGLARMTLEAHAVLRAWAEAELAIREARAAHGGDEFSIPGAEAFRRVRRDNQEIRRVRITRWLRPGTQEPYSDAIESEVIREGNKGFLHSSAAANGGRYLTERGEFDRITIEKAPPARLLPLLIESLCVPSLVEGQVPGWMPTDAYSDPRQILATLDSLNETPAKAKPDLRVIDVFVGYVTDKGEQA